MPTHLRNAMPAPEWGTLEGEREAFRSQPRELGDGQGRLFTGDNDKDGVSAFFVDHLLSCILKFIFLGGLSTNTREKWALPVGPHT
jgi:hypothetical protein